MNLARESYKAVFNWNFVDNFLTTGTSPSDLAIVDFKPGVSLLGGIRPAPAGTGLKAGPGGNWVSWLVQDVSQSSNAIEKAGGKMLTEQSKQGDTGIYRFFADTEGNVGSIFQVVKSQ